MCGIIGIISNRSRAEILEPITRGTRALAHRGPDDEGLEFLTNDNDSLTVAFGHRRLSILDLSPAGHQPMRDEATGNWITYNGEVFNFRNIRPNLEQHQIQFHSESDTEVLLKGLGLSGIEAVKDWRGMFALGLWEPNNRRLTLIRDRLGIKPLYYYYDGKTFLFASEVRSLLKTGLVPRNISRAAVEGYLTYGSVQQPLTIIENVYAVLPGHSLVFERGEIKTEPYWSLHAEANPQPIKDEREMIAEIGSLLEESVRLRMVADVPVGAFLSGGIDSSAIVALMRRATNGTIKTFSVYFNEQKFSEFAYAEHVASKFGTEHHPLLITEDDILKKLPTILGAIDQPSIDGVNSYIVSEATAQAGLKVALSGLGGDEVFAGYSYFRTVARDERLRKKVQHVPQVVRRVAASAIATVASSNRATKLTGLLRSNELHTHSLFLHRQLFTEAQREALLSRNGYNPEQRARDMQLYGEWEKRRYSACNDSDPLNQASCYDLSGYLSDTLLRDTDVMSMTHSLEVRVPLIDHQVVEHLLSISGAEKIRQATPKWLLVNAVNELPGNVVHRPKRGFEFPFEFWLKNSLSGQINEMLSSSILESIIDTQYAQILWNDFKLGRIKWSRIWGIYSLYSWVNS